MAILKAEDLAIRKIDSVDLNPIQETTRKPAASGRALNYSKDDIDSIDDFIDDIRQTGITTNNNQTGITTNTSESHGENRRRIENNNPSSSDFQRIQNRKMNFKQDKPMFVPKQINWQKYSCLIGVALFVLVAIIATIILVVLKPWNSKTSSAPEINNYWSNTTTVISVAGSGVAGYADGILLNPINFQ